MRPAPPPGNLAQQSLPLQLFAAPVFRLWQNHHPSAFFWSKKGIYRFDSKSARYGVLYTGGTLEGAALEVFGDQWVKRRVLFAGATQEISGFGDAAHSPPKLG
jgi:hypothetical protein